MEDDEDRRGLNNRISLHKDLVGGTRRGQVGIHVLNAEAEFEDQHGVVDLESRRK